VSFEFPSGRNIGILGQNGSGKSTLTKLISRADLPDRGRITLTGLISFPIGFSMAFTPHLSARDNLVILARVYNEDPEEVLEFVREFAELGEYFYMPLATYSSGMRARLSFAAAFAIDFDTYLVDEIIEVGDSRFREKCARAFAARLKYCNLCVISHNHATIRRYCDMGAVLNNGKIEIFNDLEAAITFYASIENEVSAMDGSRQIYSGKPRELGRTPPVKD
jgi:capsular polysaccharide transport system ATP-binding protein